MLSKMKIDWIKNNFDSELFSDKIITDILRLESTPLVVCPVCGEEFTDFIIAAAHLANCHTVEEIDEHIEEVNKFYNPVLWLRELEAMKRNDNPDLITTGQFFGDIITSRYNQNVMLNIYGKQGMGKSNAALDIASAVAEYVARKMGGRPDGKGGFYSGDPKDYFNMENVAIMTLETILPILKKIDQKRWNIFVFDDISGDYNAREPQAKKNKEMNKIITTFRDANCMVIITTVSDFLIDKVGRKLAHFQIEMNKQYFSHDLTIGKLKMVKENFQTGDTYYVFPVMDGVQYVKIAFERAPRDIVEEYEKKRTEIRKKFTSKSVSKMMGEEPDKKDRKVRSDAKYLQIVPEINRLQIEQPGMSIRKMADAIGVSFETARQAVKHLRGG